jgi:hypothetical protein
MKYFNLLLAVLFATAAFLQYNDPDALEWTALYLAAALVCGFAAFGKCNRWIILLVMAMSIYELASRIPSFREWLQNGRPSIIGPMDAAAPYIEDVREFLGAAVVLIVMVVQYTRCRLHAMMQSRSGMSPS